MSLIYIQSVSNAGNSIANGGTLTASLSGVSTGHLLIFAVREYATYSVKDSLSNTYTQVGTTDVWYTVSTGSGTVTFTMTNTSGGASNYGITVLEYNAQGSIPFDVSSTGSVAALTTTGSLSLTTNYDSESVLFFCANQSATSGVDDQVTQTSGPTFTARVNDQEMCCFEYAQAVAGEVTIGFSLYSNVYGSTQFMVGFRSASAWYVQITGFQTEGTISTSPYTKSFGKSVTAGNLLLACFNYYDAAITSVTDGFGVTWSPVPGTSHAASGAIYAGWWWAIAAQSGACSVSFAFTGSITSSNSLLLAEFGGVNKADTGTNAYVGYSTGPAAASVTTNYGGLVLTSVITDSSANAPVAPSGYTLIGGTGSGYGLYYLYSLVTTVGGSQSSSFTWSGGDSYALNQLAGFYLKKLNGAGLLLGVG